VDALTSVVKPGTPTPYLEAMGKGYAAFNDSQVAERKDLTTAQVRAEYEQAHERAMTMLGVIPAEVLSRVGSIPWYGSGYSLDDFIVYANYGHKQEHLAQIHGFRRRRNI